MTKARSSRSRTQDNKALLRSCGFAFADERAAIIALAEEEGNFDVSVLIRRAVRGYNRKRLGEIISEQYEDSTS